MYAPGRQLPFLHQRSIPVETYKLRKKSADFKNFLVRTKARGKGENKARWSATTKNEL